MIYLTQETEGVAVVTGVGKERQPMLDPAPGRVEAPMDENQRRIPETFFRSRGLSLLEDDLYGQARGQAVETAKLPFPQLVRIGLGSPGGGGGGGDGGSGNRGPFSGWWEEGKERGCADERRRTSCCHGGGEQSLFPTTLRRLPWPYAASRHGQLSRAEGNVERDMPVFSPMQNGDWPIIRSPSVVPTPP